MKGNSHLTARRICEIDGVIVIIDTMVIVFHPLYAILQLGSSAITTRPRPTTRRRTNGRYVIITPLTLDKATTFGLRCLQRFYSMRSLSVHFFYFF